MSSRGLSGSIFVCGATGTVGKAVLRRLHELSPSTPVKAQCRSASKHDMLQSIHSKVEFVNLDLNHVQVDLLRGVTALFLLNPYTVDMLVQGRQLIDAAKEAGVQHIVHLGVHQPPSITTMVNYVHWHRLVETYAEQSGLTWTHLRPNMFWENLVEYGGMRPIQHSMLHGDVLSFPMKPETVVAWVSADDIASVAVPALLNPSAHSAKIYPITSSISTIQDIVSALQQSVPSLKNLKLKTPDVEDTYKMLVDGGAEPVYMNGFKNTVKEMNAMGDCSVIPGAMEGLEIVKQVGGKQPMAIQEWAQKQEWKL